MVLYVRLVVHYQAEGWRLLHTLLALAFGSLSYGSFHLVSSRFRSGEMEELAAGDLRNGRASEGALAGRLLIQPGRPLLSGILAVFRNEVLCGDCGPERETLALSWNGRSWKQSQNFGRKILGLMPLGVLLNLLQQKHP